nr:unnamed protein product [Digitaria exilis]
MADIALGGVERIFKAVMAIKEAVETVHQNKKDCHDIERCVDDVYALLSELHHETDMMKNPAMRRPYDNLADSLEEALELIERCQGRNTLHRYLAAGDMAKQLRRVREDIVLKLMLGNFANSVQITITLTRTIRCGGAHPLLTHTGI